MFEFLTSYIDLIVIGLITTVIGGLIVHILTRSRNASEEDQS